MSDLREFLTHDSNGMPRMDLPAGERPLSTEREESIFRGLGSTTIIARDASGGPITLEALYVDAAMRRNKEERLRKEGSGE